MRYIRLIALLLCGLLTQPIWADESGPLTFAKVWVRLTPPVVGNTAGYFDITNSSDETVQILSVESNVAGETSLHDMVMENGGMRMEPIGPLTLKAGETVSFKPGGKHLMFVGLHEPVKAGQEIEVVFVLADGRRQELELMVMAKPQANDEHDHHKHHD